MKKVAVSAGHDAEYFLLAGYSRISRLLMSSSEPGSVT